VAEVLRGNVQTKGLRVASDTECPHDLAIAEPEGPSGPVAQTDLLGEGLCDKMFFLE
jgi:hypothetical protein